MSQTIPVATFEVSTDTRVALRVLRVLMPLVWLRLLSVELATRIVVKFVKIEVRSVSDV